jgi:hypothetical protein
VGTAPYGVTVHRVEDAKERLKVSNSLLFEELRIAVEKLKKILQYRQQIVLIHANIYAVTTIKIKEFQCSIKKTILIMLSMHCSLTGSKW